MPFETDAGPAVLVANICNADALARRLDVHINSIYNWINAADRNGFPAPLPGNGWHYDYAEVYDWFVDWVKSHPRYYPTAYSEVLEKMP